MIELLIILFVIWYCMLFYRVFIEMPVNTEKEDLERAFKTIKNYEKERTKTAN